MPIGSAAALLDSAPTRESQTYREILQQPDLWPDTIDRVSGCWFRPLLEQVPVILSGAGTSAYAGAAIEAAWPGARAIPSTDLLTGCDSYFEEGGVMISLARSGDSPETVAVIDRIGSLYPEVKHFAITCNPSGGLVRKLNDSALILDPRSNDRSLVMTSSFTNLVLAGLCLRHLEALEPAVLNIAANVRSTLADLDAAAEEIARGVGARAVVLASRPLMGIAQEACLKIMEMTAGRTVAIPETYLGLRHGPMSFLRRDTLVLCWLSNDAVRRRYEEDLLVELRTKKLGRVVCIGTPAVAADIADIVIATSAPDLPDPLRTPFDILFAQLLAYHLSLRAGLDPDNPSPDGVITRVVRGVRVHG